jgi:hypothetical protein
MIRAILASLLATLLAATAARAEGVANECAFVRAKVAEHGKTAALIWALRNGYSQAQIAQARKCLTSQS